MKSTFLFVILSVFIAGCGNNSSETVKKDTIPEGIIQVAAENITISGNVNVDGTISFETTEIDVGTVSKGATISVQKISINNPKPNLIPLNVNFSNIAPFVVSSTTCGKIQGSTLVDALNEDLKIGRITCYINIKGTMGSVDLLKNMTINGQTITLRAKSAVSSAINLIIKEPAISSSAISSLDIGTLADAKTEVFKTINIAPSELVTAIDFPLTFSPSSGVSIVSGATHPACSSGSFKSRKGNCNIKISIKPVNLTAGDHTAYINFLGTNNAENELNYSFPITFTVPSTVVACTPANSGISNVLTVTGDVGSCIATSCIANFELNNRTNRCDPLLCALPSAISPLNNSNGRIASVDTTQSLGSCSITGCAIGSEISADGKSCVIQKCALPSKILPLDNANGKILSVDTTKDVGVCAIETCSPGYVISSDKKSCVIPKCSLTDLAPLNNANGKILSVDTTKDVGSCTISSCAPGFIQSADSLSCVPKKCSMPSDILPINNANGKVLTIDTTKDLGLCEVLTCDAGFEVSSDKKSCVAAAEVCTVQNAVGNGLTSIDRVLTVKGNHPSCLVDTCVAGSSKSVDEKTCIADVVSCTIQNAIKFSSNGGAYGGNTAEPYSIEFSINESPNQSYDMTTIQYNSINIGDIISTTFQGGKKGISTIISKSIESGPFGQTFKFILNNAEWYDNGSTVIKTEIGSISSSNVTAVTGTSPACSVLSCESGYSVSSDSKSCIQNPFELTVIRGLLPQDLKCAVSIVGSPMINDNSMIIDGGTASTVNLMTPGSYSSIEVSSCAPGYEATLKSVVSLTDFAETPESAVQCMFGMCNIQMNSPKFIKMEVAKVQYPFSSIAMLGSNRIDQGASPLVTMTVPATTGGLSDALNFSFNVNDQVYTQDCAGYSSSFGSNSVYNPIFPGCASIKFSDIFEFKNWELSVSGLSSSNLNDQNLAATVVATPSTTENIVVARFDAKPATISSDIDLLTSNSYLTIYPQQEDYIELISKFYDKNLNNQISSVQLKMKNSSGTDISNIFQLTCIGITLNGNLSSNLELKNCLNSGNYINVAFSDYSSVIMTGDAYEDSLRKDDFRTGTYTAEFTVKSSSKINDCIANIPGSAGCPDVGTRIISVPITISADNDFNPTFSVYDATVPGSPKLVTDHLWTSVPYASNVGGSGFDYVIGQSTVRYATSDSAHTSPLTVPLYRNMDYAFNVGFIADSTPLNVKVDLTTIQNKNLAYNSFIRISDVRNNHSCMTVRNRRIGADSLSFANTSLRKPLNQISDFSGYNTTYIVKAQSAELVKDADTRGCSTTNSGIAAAPGAAPLLSEKYDFIGNDNWTCEAGEVCYVNNLSDSSVGAAKIAQRTFRFRVGVRNENNEVNFSAQRVRVEKADSNVSLGIAGASVNVAPLVDERFDSSFEGQLYSTNFTYDFAALTWQDTRSPLSSKVKVTVPSVSGLDCSSGCEYSFISYKNTMADYPNGTYPNSYLFTNNDLTSAPVYSSNPYGLIDMGSVELYDHNVEVLALVKKNNMTYRKIIDIAATNKIRSNPVMYMITSVYNNGVLSKLNLKYDLNKYDNNGNIVYDGTEVGAVEVSPLSYGISVRQGLYSTYAQIVNINLGSNVWNGNWLPGTDFDYTGTNLNFNKLAKIMTIDNDFYYYNFNFKQCPESTPYYLYAEGSGWGCYNSSVAQANFFLP